MGLKTTDNYTELNFQYMRVEKQPETLLEFLLRRFRYHDQAEWQDHIDNHRVLVENKLGRPQQVLKNGETITYLRPDYLEPEVNRWFETVYEDEYLIAVNKSGDLPTSPSGKYFKNTLVHVVKNAFGWKDLYTLHRLDRETSGLILFAKQKIAAQKMAEQIRNQQVKKTYLAILEKTLPYNHFFINMPIGRNPESSVRIKQWIIPEGKPSQTHFHLLDVLGNYSKVKVRPLTGRTHQIRVHAAYLGYPIVGDKLYGLPDEGFVNWIQQGATYLKEKNFPTHRQLLHAFELEFLHPITQKNLVIRASDQILMQELAAVS